MAGGIVTTEQLERLRTGLRLDFNKGLKAEPSLFDVIASVIVSSAGIETYAFLEEWPEFRKWAGERQIRQLRERAYQVENEKFELTVELDGDKVADDNTGLYSLQVGGGGRKAVNLKNRLVFDALRYGHQRLCYDGQYFFDTDHDMHGVSTSNSTGNGAVQPWYAVDLSQILKPVLLQVRREPVFDMNTDPRSEHFFKTGKYLGGADGRFGAGYTYWQLAHRCTSALTEASWNGVKLAMSQLGNENGEPLEVRPTHIVVGPSNEAAAKNLFAKANLTGGESNVLFNDVEIVVSKRLP